MNDVVVQWNSVNRDTHKEDLRLIGSYFFIKIEKTFLLNNNK